MRNLKKLQLALIATSCLLLSTFNANAQNIGINPTGAAPDSSALLDLSSTDKGFLITRVDTANIAAPAFGLMTLSPIDSCLYMYSGLSWMSLGGVGSNCSGAPVAPPCHTNLAVGDLFEGGIIFEVSAPGSCQTGKVISLNDIGNSGWGGMGTVSGATSNTDGASNTTTIINFPIIPSVANECRAHNGGGHNDWYLPAIDELSVIATVKSTIDVSLTSNGGTSLVWDGYWSSTEDTANEALSYDFGYGFVMGNTKTYGTRYRAIRSF